MQYVTRRGSFDAAHRVMDENVKCFNLHGHLYQYELTLGYRATNRIGFNIDFKDIKRFQDVIDDFFDHGAILNPHDLDLIDLCNRNRFKLWVMSLAGPKNYCNPTAENVAKELLIIADWMFEGVDGLDVTKIRLYETPNCYVDVDREDIVLDRARVIDTNGHFDSIEKLTKFYYTD